MGVTPEAFEKEGGPETKGGIRSWTRYGPPDSSPRSIMERGLYLIWMIYTMITVNLACAAGGILLYDACNYLTRGFGPLPHRPFNNMIDVMAELFLIAAINLPWCAIGRHYGVVHFRFLMHEAHLDSLGEETEESAFLGPQAAKIMALLDQIERSSAWDRQSARQQLRQWLEKNHEKLTARELDYVAEHFAYGMDPAWKRPAAKSAN